MQLTPTMQHNLRELAALGPEACWHPETAGEWRCAEALERRGLLRRNVSRGHKPYSITPDGLTLGQHIGQLANRPS